MKSTMTMTRTRTTERNMGGGMMLNPRVILNFVVSSFVTVFVFISPLSAMAEDTIGPAGTPVVTPVATPTIKNTLNAIMKHPSVPNFDRLRPMSGEWSRCKAATGPVASGTLSRQAIFSSTDANHFTRVMGDYSDRDCKVRISQARTSWVCEPATKELLSCRLLNEETGSDGAWTTVKKSEDELAASTLKLSLKPLGKKSDRKLEVRIKFDGTDDSIETEYFLLTSAATTAAAPAAQTKKP